jgi:hypothetical protein
MQITVTNDDGSTADITDAVLLFLVETAWSRAADDLTPAEMRTAVAALKAIHHPDAGYAMDAIEAEQERREDAQRRRDEWARTQAEKDADRRKAERQLAAEMREAEPALAAAGWTDAQLVQLRYMRNSGLA